jgi:hypothetical protein
MMEALGGALAKLDRACEGRRKAQKWMTRGGGLSLIQEREDSGSNGF